MMVNEATDGEEVDSSNDMKKPPAQHTSDLCVPCGITANNANDMVKRLKEGWEMIRATEPIIRDGRAAVEKR